MYLIDTNIISELRKGQKANSGVSEFFADVIEHNSPVFISAISIGELRRGVDLIYHRGDTLQSEHLENWLTTIFEDYKDNILGIDVEIALLWGKMRVPNSQHALDKLIAATALIYDMTVVTRNIKDFENTGVNLLNPFKE
jgi:predicted nucleic acid-binding protein